MSLRSAYVFLCLLIASTGITAQKRIGDYIESTSYNDADRSSIRTQQYWPEGNAFVSRNGTNRFTRALYGGHTGYRLETSDRPVFAIFMDSKTCRHISMAAEVSGKTTALDSTTFCEARYMDGVRHYVLRDDSWGKDKWLEITAVCFADHEGAGWRFTSNIRNLRIRAAISGTVAKKLSRNGDIGADKPGVFESDGEILEQAVADKYLVVDRLSFARTSSKEAEKLIKDTEAYFRQMCQQVSFRTPDAYINTLGSAIMLAADGAWDGESWLHGAIGWRTQLAGWRAGYLGDVLGWNDRAKSHFNAYAKSMVTDKPAIIPHPAQDKKLNLARAEKTWGTQMYSNGYICRKPGMPNSMNHYDMNLNFVDELLWHFQYDADTLMMRSLWPLLKMHLAWEKRNFDPDNDHLYDGYCCIWASDALYYNAGAAAHSSAYNYRANLLAARIADILGEDGSTYEEEAEAIIKAMNQRLWTGTHWAEYQDYMGLKRVHEDAAIWSQYTPVDCGACTRQQAYEASKWVDSYIPHIPVRYADQTLHTISTSDWMPYAWSINNVASAEVMNMVLAYFKAGRSRSGYNLLKANIMDQMYLGQSPGNFGQISHHDAARGECYRDFSDCTGISARALLQGLFGIVPDALNGRCFIQPGFPEEWDSVEVHTPYLSYKYSRNRGRTFADRFEVEQNFPQKLELVFIQPMDWGKDSQETVAAKQERIADAELGLLQPEQISTSSTAMVSIPFNANATDIFRQEYLSPRPPYTTLSIPKQGVGEWCHPEYCPELNDSVFRSLVSADGTITLAGIPFHSPREGYNIAYTSLWDNFPDSLSIGIADGRCAEYAHLLLAGSTNHMQTRIDNGLIIARYTDNTTDTLRLMPPFNWCPIEQDYFIDNKAFALRNYPNGRVTARPLRVVLGQANADGKALVSRNIGDEIGIKGVYGREIPGGAAQILSMPLDTNKALSSLTLKTLSNDVVIGIMAITLQ